MKTALIALNREQAVQWKSVKEGIDSQTVKPDKVYLVSDRNTTEANKAFRESINGNELYSLLEFNDIPMVYRWNPNPFLAGARRNKALDIAIKDGCDIFIFIDGDCIPDKKFVESHLSVLANSENPVATSGRRLERKISEAKWNDQRDISGQLLLYTIFDEDRSLRVQSPYLYTTSTVLWSCNFGINLKAVNETKALNEKYFGMSELFSTLLAGRWGGEDGELGVALLQSLGIPLHMVPGAVHHIEHERRESYGPDTFHAELSEMIALLDFLGGNNP